MIIIITIMHIDLSTNLTLNNLSRLVDGQVFHLENYTYSNAAVISSHIKNLVAGTNFFGVTVSL